MMRLADFSLSGSSLKRRAKTRKSRTMGQAARASLMACRDMHDIQRKGLSFVLPK